ncbi:hypothetical protein [Tichowtungia aerotolerans]|uniref:Uncharacterized protein n=1 Tax=Tichowtungia aerotolerans TaxID=2697043 RepID=A0A6P1M467_9BACT|nr:hypothetical protein [Tichowtungia aerotolerans]QHI68627.1 hypothetical protein GT409_03905 [Tichowtungia aerotolerans]
MKRIVQSAVLTAVFFGSAIADDGLDSALAALKKKTQRYNYSTQANLQNQNLAVPEEQSEEDKALDEKLRKIEKELDHSLARPSRGPAAPRMSAPRSRPQEERNWLTPALLDNTALAEDTVDSEEPSWVENELERQKSIRLEQDALKEVSAQEQRFNNTFQSRQESPFSDLKGYNQSLKDRLSVQSSSDQTSDESRRGLFGSAKERPVSPFSLSGRREKEQQEASEGLFSSRKSSISTFGIQPYSETQSPSSISTYNRNVNSGVSPTAPRSLRPSWKDQETQQLSPIEKVRKASPAYKADPFSDDFMPKIKGSIWD